MAGVIYALSNPEMPGLLKIGRTTSEDPTRRMYELYNTSVPVPFKCEIAVEVDDETGAEAAIHRMLTHCRVNQYREFFRVDASEIKPMLLFLGTRDVTPEEEAGDERESSGLNDTRGGRYTFELLGIPVGSTITCRSTGDTAEVSGSREVKFRGEVLNLTRATRLALENDSFRSDSLGYWTFDGVPLRRIYNEARSG